MPIERKQSTRPGIDSDGYYNVVHQESSDTLVAVLLSSNLVNRKNVGLLSLQRVGAVTKIEGFLYWSGDHRGLLSSPTRAIASTSDLNALPWVDLTTFASGTGTLYSTNVPLGILRITFGAYSATVPNYVIINGV